MKHNQSNHEEAAFTYDIEQLLRQGNIVQIQPQGYSMYPVFIPGKTSVLVEHVPCEKLRRGDVVLYRRDHGILVIHRICRINSQGFYLVGDNQSETEGPLRPDQIRGKMIAFIRNGQEYSVKNPVYRIFSSIWLFLLPARPFFFSLSARCKRLFGK